MKILVGTSVLQRNPVLEIICILNTDLIQDEEISADTKIEWRDLKNDYQLTSDQLIAYNNVINVIVEHIKRIGFDIVDEYQSDLSYSYYIQFMPITYEGFEDKSLGLDVKFRISDHALPEKFESIRNSNKSAGVMFKSFVIAGITHDSIQSAVAHVKKVCEDLKVGDYSELQ